MCPSKPGSSPVRALPFALAALVTLSGFLLAAETFGFVPPSSFILRRMTTRTSGIRGVTATVAGRTFADPTDPGSDAAGKLYLASPDRFRLDTREEKALTTEVWSGGTRTVRTGGKTKSHAARGAHPISGLFLGGNARAFLGERGVDLAQVSLARLGAHLCWVLGAGPGDEKRPQLWISKDSFLPVRFVTSEGEGDTKVAVDWRFDDYDRSDASTAFPRSLELRRNGVRVLRLAIVTIDVHGVPSESTFRAPPQ